MKYKQGYYSFIYLVCLTLVVGFCGGKTQADTIKIEKDMYIQMGIYNDKPILWRVLDKKDQRALLITDEVITAGSYGTSDHASIPVEWEKSLVRKWLNSLDVGADKGFYSNAFQQKEKDVLEPVKIGQVEDKVFILTYYDVLKYFPSEKSRKVGSTPEAQAKKGYTGSTVYTREGNVHWWTRTPYMGDAMTCINPFGKTVSSKSLLPNSVGVRPSIVIDSDKIYSYRGKGTKDDPLKLSSTQADVQDAPPWKESQTYKVGDKVLYRGKQYSCLQPHEALKNWSPQEAPALWIEMKQEGTWMSGKAYKVGDKVEVEGVQYRCLQDHTALEGWQPKKAPALWEKEK